MSLQKRTIQTYRQLFPNQTLREISQLTGIQITRVFRLMNGKTMKVAELEAFDQLINQKLGSSPMTERMNHLMKEMKSAFSQREMERMLIDIERRIYLKKLCQNPLSQNVSDELIA